MPATMVDFKVIAIMKGSKRSAQSVSKDAWASWHTFLPDVVFDLILV
jgi:hypothetical protein